MADTSRSQFTITLGRSGQVVKRSGAVVDRDVFEPVPAAGIKRPVRDRLGSNVDAERRDNKRQRGVNGRLSANASNSLDDAHLSKNDLRFKIMKKSQRDGKQKNVDLREMLSRKARPSSTNQNSHQSLPEPRNDRHRAPQLTPEQKDDRRCMPEQKDVQWDSVEVRTRDDRRLMRGPIEVGPRDDRRFMQDPIEVGPRDDRRVMRGPVEVGSRDDRRLMRGPDEVGPRDDRRLMRGPAEVGPRDDRRPIRNPVEVGPRDDRPLIRASIEAGPRLHTLYDDRLPNLDPTDGSVPSRLTTTRTSRTLSQMDLSKTSFSLETLDHISRPSSHKVLGNSVGLSPPPPLAEEPLRRPLMSAMNDPRPVPYTSRDIREIPRPMATTSFPIKPPISDGLTKPVGSLVSPQLPTRGMVQQSQYPVEYLTLEGFLHSLGLNKYMITFKVEEVDMATLSQMGDHDLKEMNIPMGPRKKILQALHHARNRRVAQ